jgi:hypothetical protein
MRYPSDLDVRRSIKTSGETPRRPLGLADPD